MLRYQNSIGTTLSRARSLRHHWMRNRKANSAWPRKPRASQSASGCIGFLHDGRAKRSAPEPQHAGEVEDADPKPVEHPIMRVAVATLAMIHRDGGNLPAVP